jgi:hypothetical protein
MRSALAVLVVLTVMSLLGCFVLGVALLYAEARVP